MIKTVTQGVATLKVIQFRDTLAFFEEWDVVLEVIGTSVAHLVGIVPKFKDTVASVIAAHFLKRGHNGVTDSIAQVLMQV